MGERINRCNRAIKGYRAGAGSNLDIIERLQEKWSPVFRFQDATNKSFQADFAAHRLG
jgi:hypothetical protein